MVSVHREFLDPNSEALVKGVFDERAVEYRDQRLRQNISERPQPGPEAGSEKKCFLDGRAHRARGGGSGEQMQGLVSAAGLAIP